MKIFGILFALCSTFAYGETFKGTADWQATGNPGMVKIDGAGGKVTGTVERSGGKVAGTFDCQLNDFQTGIDTRDHHMREKYLETAKFPVAQLKLDPVGTGDFDSVNEVELHGPLRSTGVWPVSLPARGTSIPPVSLRVPRTAGDG